MSKNVKILLIALCLVGILSLGVGRTAFQN